MIKDLVAQLDAIGSPGGIAELFRKEGIVGKVKKAYDCPVANYLLKKSENYTVGVAVTRVAYHDPDTDEIEDIGIGENVQAFVANFDMGIYPYLIED